ncbi:MAG: sigma-70 family RNA polymerase sigma factor [Planctomycetales bacterium]|nr:sigma-70 family RNA polymerase sigma factor [Planctomycetales bacterium]
MSASEWRRPAREALLRARDGDPSAVGEVLMTYRDQLKRVVRTRLDRRLASRLDASDVVNDVLGAACESVAEWLQQQKSIYACLHRSLRTRLALLHRDHIGAQKRSVTREARLVGSVNQDSVMLLCRQLAGSNETPSRAAARVEICSIVRSALAELPDTDREIVVLRSLEGTPTSEVAELLDLTAGAVKMRYLRAIRRLRTRLNALN